MPIPIPQTSNKVGNAIIIMPNLKVPQAITNETLDIVNDTEKPENPPTEPLPVSKPKKTRGTRKAVVPKKRAKKYNSRKIQKTVTKCEHVDEKYYSRGLCKNCYHKSGRIKLAVDC